MKAHQDRLGSDYMVKRDNVIIVTSDMSMDKIQERLKKSGYTIQFRKGVYNITKTLYLYSNTKIVLDDGTVLVRKFGGYVFMTYASSTTTLYNGQKNIDIIGGKIKANGSKKVSNIISLVHSENISVKNLTIENNVGSHAIEINSSKNVTIDNCTFDGNTIAKGGEYREAIQIDSATFIGLTYSSNKNAQCYDSTHCENINIKNCKFIGFNICLGTHTQTSSNKKHTNINLLNNTCVGIGEVKGYGSCFKIMNFEDVLIEGNQISKFARGIEICSSNRFYSSNGKITKVKPSSITGSHHITIRNNYIFNPSKDYQASGIFINSQFDNLIHDDILIEDNTFELNNGVSQAEVFYNSATNVVLKNNTSDI